MRFSRIITAHSILPPLKPACSNAILVLVVAQQKLTKAVVHKGMVGLAGNVNVPLCGKTAKDTDSITTANDRVFLRSNDNDCAAARSAFEHFHLVTGAVIVITVVG